MRHPMLLWLCTSCVPAGRAEIELSAELTSPVVIELSDGARIELETAQIVLSELFGRERATAQWGAERLDDRPQTPVQDGVAIVGWTGPSLVDLLDPRTAFLGVALGWEGEMVAADLGVSGTSRWVGRRIATDGSTISFDWTLRLQQTVRGIAASGELIPGVTERLALELRTDQIFDQLPWEQARNGELGLPTAIAGFSFAVGDRRSWSLETR